MSRKSLWVHQAEKGCDSFLNSILEEPGLKGAGKGAPFYEISNVKPQYPQKLGER